MRALEFIRDHVTFKLPYDFSYHMKTPLCHGGLYKDLRVYVLHFFSITSGGPGDCFGATS